MTAVFNNVHSATQYCRGKSETVNQIVKFAYFRTIAIFSLIAWRQLCVRNITLSPRRYPYFGVVLELVWSYDPESYAGSSIWYW